MSFLVLIGLLSVFSWLAQRLLAGRAERKAAMRHGMAGGFLFTGVDHFLSAEARYVPMLPEFLAPWGWELVYLSGAAELAGALGLLISPRWCRARGLPDLRRWAGLGLALLLAVLVVANVHVALSGGSVKGLEFGAWYYWLRPLLQPVFIWWALSVSRGTGILARDSSR